MKQYEASADYIRAELGGRHDSDDSDNQAEREWTKRTYMPSSSANAARSSREGCSFAS